MRQIVWAESAREDYREAIRFLRQRYADAARKPAMRIGAAVQGLAAMPTGRRGRIAGIYEKVVPGIPYLAAYAIRTEPTGEEMLVILAIVHTARDWPEGQWPRRP